MDMGIRHALVVASLATLVASATAQAFHVRKPNEYRAAVDDNVATALDAKLAAGDLTLVSQGRSGRLRALLAALAVPESSQTLVFSKTSLQRHRISPHSPRAIYFGRDAYVGWVPGAAALEVAVSDAKLGMAFYTVPQDPATPARFVRDDSCLSCHATGHTDDEPGVVLRSVFADENGDPIASAGESNVTMRTPMAERWGGWLVTGKIDETHRGNGTAVRGERGRWRVESRSAVDLGAFADRFAAADYLAPTSDVGALLALEQQATVHNLLIKAMLQTRCLLQTDREVNAMLGEEGLRESTAEILDDLARKLVTALLMGGEAATTDANATPDARFAADFVALWPQSADGPRIGELTVAPRTFSLPLSPMVHSRAFAALPEELRELVLRQLRRALAKGRLPRDVQVSKEQRLAIDAHLRATLPGYADG